MGLMEKYVKWKKGEIFNITGTDKYMVELFKTGINEDQVLILEKYEKHILVLLFLALALYFMIGAIGGLLLGALI